MNDLTFLMWVQTHPDHDRLIQEYLLYLEEEE